MTRVSGTHHTQITHLFLQLAKVRLIDVARAVAAVEAGRVKVRDLRVQLTAHVNEVIHL